MKTYLSIVFAAAVFFAAVAATSAEARDSGVSALYVHIEACRHEISLLDRELQQLGRDRQWLENKISTMGLMNRPVPRTLHQSVAYKQNQLTALENIRDQYYAVLADLTATLPDPKKTASGPPESGTKDSGDLEQNAAHALLDQLQAYNLADWFDVAPARHQLSALVTTLPILFPSGSAVVAKEYQDFFKRISAFIKDRPMHILVDGFADPDPINTSRYPSNFELGAARAANVVHALVKHGVDPAKFKLASTGRYRFPDAAPMSGIKSVERYVRITLLPDAS